MTVASHVLVALDELRIGLYVDLELGWMSHPFPKGNFKITSQRQIETLRGLGLTRVRCVPERSDPPEPSANALESDGSEGLQSEIVDVNGRPPSAPTDAVLAPSQVQAAAVADQSAQLELCDRQFESAIRQYREVIERIPDAPLSAADLCRRLVDTIVDDMLAQSESSIRLLSETAGDRIWMHPVNVTVLTLLLGKALGLPVEALRNLGVAAVLHDVGKMRLADRVRLADINLTPAEYRTYQTHVAQGVQIARQLLLCEEVQRTIGQHHERLDGSGFPRQSLGADISQSAKVLGLVNCYENMCNPVRPSAAITPHEALSTIFSQMKRQHDITVLAAFIRMMGVYPPGSVVQLTDGRHALVVSVNSTRPLKPRVMAYEPGIPREEALILDLEKSTSAGIRRSLRPDMLPPEAAQYLAPRLRICYYFERAADPVRGEVIA